MARVLHLFEHNPDYQTQTTLSQLARSCADAALCTIGPGGDFGLPLRALSQLRGRARSFDLIHAWGQTALRLAAIAGGKPTVFSPTRFPTRTDPRWIRALLGAKPIQVICPTDTMRRFLVERGVPIRQCHLIRPAVDFSRIQPRRNEDLRRRLRFAPDDFVLLAAGESQRSANHHAAILAAAVLHVFDPHYKLLLWGRGPLAGSERTYCAQMLPENFVAIATDRLDQDVSFEQLLPAANAALVTADGPVPPLPIAACMAAALPIVAVVSPTVAEMLEDRYNALMVGRCTSRLLARRVLDLQEDSRLAWSIRDAARTDAYEYFSMTRLLKQFGAVYQQIAENRPVEVPQEAPGAGARFSGRE